MTVKCDTCTKDVSTIDDVRGCHLCQANGTAGKIHCKHLGSDAIENALKDGGGLPFSVMGAPEAQPVEIVSTAEEVEVVKKAPAPAAAKKKPTAAKSKRAKG